MKTTYYFSENNGGYRKAERLSASSLTSAKREASRKSAFYGTRLEIGDSITSDGFLANVLSVKENGAWKNA